MSRALTFRPEPPLRRRASGLPETMPRWTPSWRAASSDKSEEEEEEEGGNAGSAAATREEGGDSCRPRPPITYAPMPGRPLPSARSVVTRVICHVSLPSWARDLGHHEGRLWSTR